MLFRNKIGKKLAFKNALVIVAHPEDETLWAGGIIKMHPETNWTVLTLCRANYADRASKFDRAVTALGAEGIMCDLDDGPEQIPLDCHEVQCAIMELLPSSSFDLVVTHGSEGEFIRHRRYTEVGQAVVGLWEKGKLQAGQMWRFAYEEGDRSRPVKSSKDADMKIKLPRKIYKNKYNIITRIYGFAPDSLDAKAAPRQEAFRRLTQKEQEMQ